MPVELIMTKGLPGSGKSTWAKNIVDTFGDGAFKVVNKDSLRLMLDNGKWSKNNEEFVLQVRDYIVRLALLSGKHIIVDDTNLAPKHETALRALAKEYSALFKIKDFTNVPLQECIANDLKRAASVGEQVIRSMYDKYLKPAPQTPPAHDPKLPDAVIVDIDGTVAKMKDRSPYEWAKVGQDEVRHPVVEVIKAIAGENVLQAHILFVSGRDEVCRKETLDWLIKEAGFNMFFNQLFMRPKGDQRRDSIVKREIHDEQILGKYNVVAIFDDRPQVLRECWQALGYGDRLFNVGDGTEF